MILTLCFVVNFNTVSNAATITSGTIELDDIDYDSVNFWVYEPSIIVIDLNIRLANNGITSNDKFVLELEQYPAGDVIEKDVYTLPSGYSGYTFTQQFYCPQVLPRDKYAYTFNNDSVHDLIIEYTIRSFPAMATSFTPETTTVSMTAGKNQLVKINPIPSNSYLAYDSITSSNSKIAEVYWEKDGVRIYAQKAGTCYINITSYSGCKSQIKVVVTNPTTPKLQYKSYKMCMGETLQNTLLYNNKKVKWSTSNKKVATVNSKGKITAKGIGKATITAKVGSKKYTCKVTVVRQNPDFYARLSWYNTRSNYFEVDFYNNSNKSVTVYSSGAKVMHVAFKSYDRNLKLKKSSIVIKPHKSATIRFYVKGRVTWYDYERYTLQYKFKFDKKTYTGRTWDEASIYKSGSKWYNSYWDEEAYEYWTVY